MSATTNTRNDDTIKFTHHSPGKKEHYTEMAELVLDTMNQKELEKMVAKVTKELKRRKKEDAQKEKERLNNLKKEAKTAMNELNEEFKELTERHEQERKVFLSKKTKAENKYKEVLTSQPRDDKARKYAKWGTDQEIFLQTQIQTHMDNNNKKASKPTAILAQFRDTYPNTNRNDSAILSKINGLKTVYNRKDETDLRLNCTKTGEQYYKDVWHNC